MVTQEVELSMQKSVEASQRNFNTIRTGRANTSLLDRLTVEYYGADTPLKSLATISTPDSQTIAIQPFDLSSLSLIEKAISTSDLGFTPNNDGKIVRINIPPLTEERRKQFCKLASKYAEEAKIALRNIRRDAIEKIKTFEKNKELGQDESKKYQSNIENITSEHVKMIDASLKNKEEDLKNI